MKTFFGLLLLLIITFITVFTTDIQTFKKEKYIDQKVLDLSAPLNVTIDTELLNSLKPANE